MKTTQESRRPRVFNTPLESGLRALVLLTTCYPAALGLRRLIVLDYLLVHTADIGGPKSLHPKEGARAAELLVRRKLVSDGLALMGQRGLIVRSATDDGFKYRAGDEAGTFIDYLRSDYSSGLKVRAHWLRERILPIGEADFDELVRAQMDVWTPEFARNLAG